MRWLPLRRLAKGLLPEMVGGFFPVMHKNYDKPFLDYHGMIALLESRGLIIHDKAFAEKALGNISYYNLVNKIKCPAIVVSGSDAYKPGTTFDQLYTIYSVDSDIESVILKYILSVETSLKSHLTYTISSKYGVDTDTKNINNDSPYDYLYRKNYSSAKGRRDPILKSLKETAMGKGQTSGSLEHYRSRHNHIPPWILSTSISFMQSILWYSILKWEDKKSVLTNYFDAGELTDEQIGEYFMDSLKLLREYRNMIAHEVRTIGSSAKKQLPKVQTITLSGGIITSSEYKQQTSARSGLFAVITSLVTLINDPFMRVKLILDLNSILSKYNGITINGRTIFNIFGFPDDIVDRLLAYNCKH